MSATPSIAVFGAGGHTGRFVVDALDAAGAHAIPVTRTGRFTGRDGQERQGRVLDVAEPAALDRILIGADALINCAGPFFDTAEPAASAAIRAGIPYLDVAAEQWTTQRLFERLHVPAVDAEVIVAPAMAFFGGLADLLVSAIVANAASIDNVRIAVGLDSWNPTLGTRKTGARNDHQRLIVSGGELAAAPPPPPAVAEWTFPTTFGVRSVQCVPLSEIILLASHVRARSISSYMNLKPLQDLKDPSTPPPAGLDDRGRSRQIFVLDVLISSGGVERRAYATGHDIYAASATLVVKACLAVLEQPHCAPGVRAAGEILVPRAFLQKLAPDIAVHLDDPFDG